jgi:exonuclease III
MSWILFPQEVTDPAILNVTGYATYLNIGAKMRGTAILARNEFPLTKVTTLPSWRAIAADHDGIRLDNVYAPSGTTRKRMRNELPELCYAASHCILIGGEFNCVLKPADTTRPFTLSEIVRGLALSDAWNQDPQRPNFTHYSRSGATRIDRFYMTNELLVLTTDIEILPAAFTDHNTVVLRLSIPTVGMSRR